ncbi:MAG TPA: LysR family transcriptional regulator [Piscinibacter sp.]|jgi:LysR family transcriptional activator of nhaA|uniref:LysR family transcriptional regulator n=1 Tax=Piscinibacter sp. TaxID=1903157 RepID=UPI0011DB9950|nr:LysR family transcriptional regulator [Piscinibacter sp.]TXH50148.1 MAG: LysR family transcriptional regulator [Burkholderiaceae bacterium]MBP5990476.1 LysR family transcriptional regulator [Piscinibacter sp.]MBP6027737.1 LysR family transcriptional regulator [Piscinibacter sp.]HNJ83581.1 LysR family transcriptional regulator [Piscinibacter sp.]HNK18390.1 LysR family transcriptional regulator [Piscinibacter sp.]
MLNYRHLYYFWVVAKEGGFARAAERLDMAIQTISAQVKALEQELGHQLLKPAGRGVAVTDAGQAVLARAEEIFRLGERIGEEAAAAASGQTARLAVGMSDGLPKLAAHVLLKPVLDTPALKLLCHEGKVDDLLAELALHRLDVVLACQPAPQNSNLRLSSERLMVSPVHWYGPSTLVHKAQIDAFPASLGTLPLLLPTTHAAMRGRIDRWFESQDIRPRIVGEFEDSALLSLFAAQGLGVFPVTALGATDLAAMRGLRLLGRSDGLIEEIHAIRSRRGLHHPLVLRILAAARDLAPAPD